MDSLLTLAYPLFLTLIVETLVYYLPFQKRIVPFLLMGVLNTMLNITMNAVLIELQLGPQTYWLALWLCELIVFLIEGTALFLVTKKLWAYGVSLLANGCSLGLGLAMNLWVIEMPSGAYLTLVIVLGVLYLIEFSLILYHIFKNH